MTEPDKDGLNAVERKLITLMARGLVAWEIAEQLHWGVHGVASTPIRTPIPTNYPGL